MEFRAYSNKDFNARVSFHKDMECHIMVYPTDKSASASDTIDILSKGLSDLLEKPELLGFRPVFQRYFLSDIAIQRSLVPESEIPTSVIQQPSLDGSKAVLWVWLMNNVSSDFSYSFGGEMLSDGDGSYSQMKDIFQNYEDSLDNQGLTTAEHCARTWIFVRDVDVNYQGIVEARKELFNRWGLTADTHYLASTGINGLMESPKNLVMMDTYTVKGLSQEKFQYLHALDNLSPTHVYGVTFERGTALHFGDRTQILISGTASIDNKGEIVAPGDIDRQTERTLENIQALLTEAGADFKDIAQMIVYIRDIADYKKVENYVSTSFPDIPKVITWAPVCRPGWLVEIECIAYV